MHINDGLEFQNYEMYVGPFQFDNSIVWNPKYQYFPLSIEDKMFRNLFLEDNQFYMGEEKVNHNKRKTSGCFIL